jgi:hypothetical protein
MLARTNHSRLFDTTLAGCDQRVTRDRPSDRSGVEPAERGRVDEDVVHLADDRRHAGQIE